jgi:hypothetical protein
MPREITHHGEILEAIGHSGIISELVETHEGHLEHELDIVLSDWNARIWNNPATQRHLILTSPARPWMLV